MVVVTYFLQVVISNGTARTHVIECLLLSIARALNALCRQHFLALPLPHPNPGRGIPISAPFTRGLSTEHADFVDVYVERHSSGCMEPFAVAPDVLSQWPTLRARTHHVSFLFQVVIAAVTQLTCVPESNV